MWFLDASNKGDISEESLYKCIANDCVERVCVTE